MSAILAAALSVHLATFLCDDAAHAIQFAARIASHGDEEEMAADYVGKRAGAQVCGFFAGKATVESQKIVVQDGMLYRLTAFRFVEDHRLAWLAEVSFAPGPASYQQDL